MYFENVELNGAKLLKICIIFCEYVYTIDRKLVRDYDYGARLGLERLSF